MADLLAEKVVVVTGGGGGIGAAVATRCAAEGAKVIVVDIDAARAEAVARVIDGVAVVADVTTAEGIDATRREADGAGGVDVLVNNVGHFLYRRHDFVDSTEAEWTALHEVNLLHVLRACHALLPGMLSRGRGGSIVNLTTIEAHRGIPQHAVYSAYKAAVEAFTRSLALEVSGAGVRVNAIAPDLTQSLQLRFDEWVPEDERHRIPTWVPLGRFGTPDDIAGVVLFLASSLSNFVTGVTVHADGGSRAAGGWVRMPAGGWTNRPVQRDP
jgi:NAD(P)-dependent dehydrogenase (short-subunit alcohol dehydrogenase family)